MMYLRFWYIFEWTNPWRNRSTHWRCSCLNLFSASHQKSIQDFLYSIELQGWTLYMQSNWNSGSTMSVYTTNAHHMQTHAHAHKSFLMTWSLILLSAVSWICVYGEHLMHSPLWSFSDCELEVPLCFMFSKTTCVSPSFKICWHLAWQRRFLKKKGEGCLHIGLQTGSPVFDIGSLCLFCFSKNCRLILHKVDFTWWS